MNVSKSIPIEIFRNELRAILGTSVGTDYAWYIVNNDYFVESVKQNVEETSAWADEGFYNDDDIRLAVGRIMLDYLGIPY